MKKASHAFPRSRLGNDSSCSRQKKDGRGKAQQTTDRLYPRTISSMWYRYIHVFLSTAERCYYRFMAGWPIVVSGNLGLIHLLTKWLIYQSKKSARKYSTFATGSNHCKNNSFSKFTARDSSSTAFVVYIENEHIKLCCTVENFILLNIYNLTNWDFVKIEQQKVKSMKSFKTTFL